MMEAMFYLRLEKNLRKDETVQLRGLIPTFEEENQEYKGLLGYFPMPLKSRQ